MNTPKTRKPKRWKPSTVHTPVAEAGTYFGIKNPEIGAAYGFMVSYWWHVEEQMVLVFQDLIDGRRNDRYLSGSAARNIFRTVVAQEARIKLMRSLLEGAPHNHDAPALYDEILDEFAALNGIRNNLVHGSWTTDIATGEVTVRRSSNVPNELQQPEKITETYLTEIANRMMALYGLAALRGGPPITLHGTPARKETAQSWQAQRTPEAKS